LASTVLVPWVAAVLHGGGLPSMNDGKRKGQGRGKKGKERKKKTKQNTTQFFLLPSVSNVF